MPAASETARGDRAVQCVLVAVIFWIPLQNFVLAAVYTNLDVSPGVVRAVLISKEIAVLALVPWVLLSIAARKRPLPVSCRLALLWLALVAAFSLLALLQGGEPFPARDVRNLVVPAAAFLLGFQAAFSARALARLTGWVVAASVAVAAFGLVDASALPHSFWKERVNVAAYNRDVKGDSPQGLWEPYGISGSALGRDVFRDLFPRRASSTYGDPIALAHGSLTALLVSLGVVMSRAEGRTRRRAFGAAAVLLAALFLTFTRSAWLAVLTGSAVLAWQSRHLWRRVPWRPAALLALSVFALFLLWEPARTFLLRTFDPRIDPGHRAGIVGFYRDVLTDLSLWPGGGIGFVPLGESGYAFIMGQLGLPGLAIFVGFVVAAAWELLRAMRCYRAGMPGPAPLPAVACPALAALLLSSLVTLHFSTYVFTFTTYFTPLALAGALVGGAGRLTVPSRAVPRPAPAAATAEGVA